VANAIRECVASLRSGAAQQYASYFGAAASGGMCVVVQQMVKADAAGVCFTRDPNGGGIRVEAVEGLGENLVSGRAETHIYREEDGMQGDALLSAELLRELADSARKAREALNAELDMEWAVQDGTLYWLQARPITVADAPDPFELDTRQVSEGDVLTTCNVGEMLPGAVTPLSLSTSVAGIDYGMRKMIWKSGCIRRIEDIPPQSCIANFGNHLFINITQLYRIGDHVVGATREGVALSLCGRTLPGTPQPPVPKVSTLAKLNNARKYFSILLGVKGACKKIKRLAERKGFSPQDDPAALLREIDGRLWEIDEAFWLHYIASAYSGSMSSALQIILMEQKRDEEEIKRMLAGALEDIEGIESVDILRALRRLARALMKEHPEAAEMDAAQLAPLLARCGPESRAALEQFYKRHGHRAIREAEMRSKSWHMDEESLCGYLKSVIASGAQEPEKPRAAKADPEILAGQEGAVLCMMRYLVAQARRGVVYREFTKSMSIKVLDRFKTAYRRAGDLLVEKGLLPDADLVFFLKHEELMRLAAGEAALVKKAAARRRVLETQKAFRFGQVCVGPAKPAPPPAAAPGSRVLPGSSISRGCATGPARVVRSVEDACALQRGEIMVASFTDIGWSPYYCMLGGLVTEVGSALSHGAVVAREYALPLVSGVKQATQAIRTGDIIRGDADPGYVEILA
jgi:pyruvate,water dikinase